MARPKADVLRTAIEDKRGNIASVARHFGVSRRAVYKWLDAMPSVKETLEDARETMLDNAESVLYKKILEGSTPELLFFLKTQGKNRGYVERQEITGAEGGPLLIQVDK